MALKFRTQLTLTLSVIILATVALISLLSNFLISREFEKYREKQQKSHAMDIATHLSYQYHRQSGQWNLEYVHGVGMSSLYEGYIIRLMDLEQKIIWDAQNHNMAACTRIMQDISKRMKEERPALKGSFVSQSYDLKQNHRTVGFLVIQYYSPYFFNESEFSFLSSLNLILLIIGSFALLSSLAAGSLLAKRISCPVFQAAYMAKQITNGNYKIRCENRLKTKELNELVSSINHMAAFLDHQEEQRKRLTNDIAHELRTPLAALSSHLETMIEGIWEPTKERLQGCYEELTRMTGLVSDLERLAKVENENLTLEKTQLDLVWLAHTVAGNLEPERLKKNISFSIVGSEAFVYGDKDRLNQVLTNLLSNAIKYTPENGNIRITIEDLPEKSRLTIEDNGIGIPKEELPLIFDRFYRTDKSRSRSTGGTGIGLTIVKSIVSAHQGTVTAKSGGEQGSTFTVELPKQ